MFKNKSTLAKLVLTVLFLHLFIYSCKENIEEDFVPDQEQAVSMVSHEDIPSIISKLNETVNPAPIDETRGSVAPSSLGDINMVNIMEVLDSLEHRNYTFLVDDNDDDPYTFTNLIVKKRSDGSVDHPYLLEYRVDSAQRDEFLASKFAMDAFTGVVTKRFLDGSINNSRRGVANLGGRGEFTPNSGGCDRDYNYTSGTSGGVDNNAGPTVTNSFGGGSTLICWDVMEPVEVPITCDNFTSSTTGGPSTSDFDGCSLNHQTGNFEPIYGGTTTKYVLSRKCSYVRSQGIEDDSMCPPDGPGSFGVFNNGFGEYLNKKPLYSTVSQLKDYMEMAAAELSQYADTQEAALAMYNTSLQPLTVSELQTLSIKSWNVYKKLEQVNFRMDWLSTANQKQVAADAAFVDLYPEIKERVNDSGWPLSTEEWEAVWEILKPMLGDVLLEAIPGGGLTLAFRDLVEGTQNSDALALTAGLVGIIVEFFPAAKVFKAVYRVSNKVRKVFKYVKRARNYLTEIGQAIKASFKADIDGLIVVVSKNGNEVARISNNVMTFRYTGFGGDILTNANKTTTVIGKWQNQIENIWSTGLAKQGVNPGGMNILGNVPSGTVLQRWAFNRQWLNDVISRGDAIRVTADPLDINNVFYDTSNIPSSVFQSYSSLKSYLLSLSEASFEITDQIGFFGREVRHLFQNGYSFDPITNQFIK